MAVYTEVGDRELQAFLAGYDIGAPLSFKGIAEGVENSNYLLVTEAGRFILTLYEKRVSETDLPFFLGLMDHLSARGLACPRPLARKDGARFARLAGRPTAIVTFLEGLSVREASLEHCAAVGGALAALHRAGADFTLERANALGPAGWAPLASRIGARADTIAPGLASTLAGEIAFARANWPSALPRGVIHADLFPDNVFFKGERLSGLIDFYFACTDYLAYDLAVALNAWCLDVSGACDAGKVRALVGAYEAVRPLSEAERRALPTLSRGAALRFLLTRALDWLEQVPGALVRPKDPLEYARKLAFHRAATGPQDYGLDG